MLFLCCACKQKPDGISSKNTSDAPPAIAIAYATGFSIKPQQDGYVLTINKPWPDATTSYTYYITNGNKPSQIKDAVTLHVPVKKAVVTSTTHITPLDLLDVIPSLIGYPGTDYISNKFARKRIDAGKVTDLGTDQNMSVEHVISLQPDVVMGYGINSSNSTYDQIASAGIPVIFNGEWIEEHPLGRAEWIKVFGLLYDKVDEANRIFNQIETDYLATLDLLQNQSKPTVLAGASWKDVWYLPYGNSWQGKIITDAQGDYIYKNTTGKGSLAYNIERVLTDAQQANVWIAPGQYTSYSAMKKDLPAYALFKAFKNKRVYTFGLTKGAKGGVTYYEEASMRPDIVLKDIAHILHPDLFPDYTSYFFKPLTD